MKKGSLNSIMSAVTLQTAWKQSECRRRGWWNGFPRTAKCFILRLNISCRARTIENNFVICSVSPCFMQRSSLYPPSAMTFSPACRAFFIPILKIFRSEWDPQGKGPWAHTIFLVPTEIPSAYHRPAPLNLWENHMVSNGYGLGFWGLNSRHHDDALVERRHSGALLAVSRPGPCTTERSYIFRVKVGRFGQYGSKVGQLYQKEL